ASSVPRLLLHILRQDWVFKGYIVSDCDSVDDIYKQHKSAKSAEEGAAMALRAGMDLDCGHAYAALEGAVKQGLVTEAQIDTAVRRLMLARMQLGMFDPPDQVKWAQIPHSANQSLDH